MAGMLGGRRVLVTGASSGIGAATAREAVAAGARVALLARRTSALTELADEFGPDALSLTCDITDEAGVAVAVGLAATGLGGLDALVNAAGLFAVGPVADTGPPRRGGRCSRSTCWACSPWSAPPLG